MNTMQRIAAVLRTLYPVVKVYLFFIALAALLSRHAACLMAAACTVSLVALVVIGCQLLKNRPNPPAPPPEPETIVPAGMFYEVRCPTCSIQVFRRPVPHTDQPTVPGSVYTSLAEADLHDHFMRKPECITPREAIPIFVPPLAC